MRPLHHLLRLGLASVFVSGPVHAQASGNAPIQIRLVRGIPAEEAARDQLVRVLARWDLSRWFFTRSVQIDSLAIPHGHPVLTLNTGTLANDSVKAKGFIHEELHWFLSRHHASADSAVDEVRRLYPEPPPESGTDRESKYLHLLVGVLELDAVTELFGETTARRMVARTPFYTWVYREVLDHGDPIRSILHKHAFDSPDART
ncbi:MAG: hypothetical protein ABJF01_23140 [bacterium]